MAYQDTIDLTATTNDLFLVNSQAGATYAQEPDARVANIKTKAVYGNFIISSGGTLFNNIASATISGAHIYDQGLISGDKATIFSNVVVHSGGTLNRTSTGSWLVNATIYSGAVISNWNGGATRIGGTNTVIESGAIVKYGDYTYYDVYTDENHAVHNFEIRGAVHLYSGITFVDATMSSLLYLHNGTTVLGATNNGNSGGTLAVYKNCTVQNVKLDNAAYLAICNSGTTLGGAETSVTFKSGGAVRWCIDDNYAAGDYDKDINISGGVITGMKLLTSSHVVTSTNASGQLVTSTHRWLHDITLNNGIQANAPQISSGGTLTIGSGGIASGAKVNFSGALIASSGGTLLAPTVYSGGLVYAYAGASITDPTVVSNGGVYVYSGATISGGGVSGRTSTAAGFISAAAGAVISGAITVSRFGVMAGGDFSNEGASLNLLNSAGIGGTTLNVAKEKLFFDGTASTDAYVENGVLHDLVLSNRTLTVAYGLKFDNITLRAGARLNVESGTTLTDTVVSGGVCYIYGDCKTSGCTISGGSMSTFTRAQINDLTIRTGKLQLCSNTGKVSGVTMYGGSLVTIGLVSGATVSGGYIVANKDGVVSNAVLYGNNTTATAQRRLYLSSGGVARDITFSGGMAIASQGAAVSGAIVDSGYLWFFDPNTETGKDDRPVISGSGITIHANGRTTFRGVNVRGSHIEVTEAGGYVCAQNGAVVDDVILTNGGSAVVYVNDGTGVVDSGATVTMKNVKVVDGVVSVGLGGTVDGIDMQAGTISCYNASGAVVNARISGGTVKMLLGTLSDATVGSGAVVNISGGVTVTGLTAAAGAEINVLYKGTTGIGTAIFDTLDNVTSVNMMSGIAAGNTYVLTTADAATTVIEHKSGLYGNGVAKGETFTNAFDELTYSFDGTTYSVAAQAIGTVAAAAKLADGATTINGSDKAAKWDATTTYSANVFLADGLATGNAWLNIDGFA